MRDKSHELAERWLLLVETDIQVARRILPDLPAPAAFHVQQAIEKLLKAAIVLNHEEPPRIHDLKRLYAIVRSDLLWSEQEEWLAEKTSWSSETRYGAMDVGAQPTLGEITDALVSVERLLAEVRLKID